MDARRTPGTTGRTLRALAAAAMTLGAAGVAGAQPHLTGANLTYSDGSGNFSGTYWNTLGADGWYNLYVRQGATWMNSGDGPSTSIDIPLALGANTLTFYAQPGALFTYAMNLFFDAGQTLGISVKGETGSAAFSANAAAATTRLDHSTIAGANSLSYGAGGYTTTLTALEWTGGADVVGPWNNSPCCGGDYVGTMTLTVVGPASHVTPEPATLALLGTGLAGVAGAAAGRRRARA